MLVGSSPWQVLITFLVMRSSWGRVGLLLAAVGPGQRPGTQDETAPTSLTRIKASRAVNRRSGSRPKSVPPMRARPEVGRWIPAVTCSNVDLSDPDGPITTVNSAEPNATVGLVQRGDRPGTRTVSLRHRIQPHGGTHG
jgi:hypothetical protein